LNVSKGKTFNPNEMIIFAAFIVASPLWMIYFALMKFNLMKINETFDLRDDHE
jgi:hypothetical protein